jgi:hypothetical protein
MAAHLAESGNMSQPPDGAAPDVELRLQAMRTAHCSRASCKYCAAAVVHTSSVLYCAAAVQSWTNSLLMVPVYPALLLVAAMIQLTLMLQ